MLTISASKMHFENFTSAAKLKSAAFLSVLFQIISTSLIGGLFALHAGEWCVLFLEVYF